jgi:hypothetical protein
MKLNKTIFSTTLLTLLVFGTVLILKKQIFKQTVQTTGQLQPGAGFTKQLLHKLDIPFVHDTLVFESSFRPCGNCSMELPVAPGSEDTPFVNKLFMLANRKIPPTKGFTQIMDTVQIYGILNSGSEVASRTKKIYAIVRAEQSRENGRVYVYENYLYLDTFKQVLKEFEVDKKGTWHEVGHRKIK